MKCKQPDCTYTEDTGAIANRLTFTNYYCIECGSGLEVAVGVIFLVELRLLAWVNTTAGSGACSGA